MTNRVMKYFLGLLAFNVVLACGFNLFMPAKPDAHARLDNQAAKPLPTQGPLEKSPVLSRASDFAPLTTVAGAGLITNEENVLIGIRDWAQKKPEDALAWALQLPEGVERTEALTDACFKIAQTDPARAVSLAGQFHLQDGAILENLVQQWAMKDLTSAYNWSMTQSPGGERTTLLARVALVWSQSDPESAARLVIDKIPAGPEQDEAVMTVLHQWATHDFDGAKAWVQEFSQGSLRDRALHELAGIAQEH